MQVQSDLKKETQVRKAASTASPAALQTKKRRNAREGLGREFRAAKVKVRGGEEQDYDGAGAQQQRACPPPSSAGSRDYHYVSDHHFRSGSSSSRQSRNRYATWFSKFFNSNILCFYFNWLISVSVAATARITTRLMWPPATHRRHLPPEDQGVGEVTANITIWKSLRLTIMAEAVLLGLLDLSRYISSSTHFT